MDTNYIDMHLLTDRYLQGTLADGEKAEFEERLVWDQELIDELDLAERLRDGLRESMANDRYTVSPGTAGMVGRLFDLLAVPQYAAVASFVLGVTLTVGVSLSPLMPDPDDQVLEATATPTEINPVMPDPDDQVLEATATPTEINPVMPDPDDQVLEATATPTEINPVMPDPDNQVLAATATPTEIIPRTRIIPPIEFGLFIAVLRSPPMPVTPTDTTILLLVQTVGTYDSYRVTVRKDVPGAEPVWLHQLLPTDPVSLAVSMPKDLLAAGRHLLNVEGVRVSETSEQSFELIQEIPFDVSSLE